MRGVGKEGGGVSSFFPPQGSSKIQGKKKGKITMRKKPRKGNKKREGFNQKRPVCTQNALRRFRQGFEEKTPRFGGCREVRVDLISFFWGRSVFGGEGAFLGVFSALSAAASERSQQHQKEAFLPQSEAGRAGRWLQELSLGKKKSKTPQKTPRREGLEQARGEGTIIMFSGFFSKTSSRNG